MKFCGAKRRNAKHRSATDADCRFVSKAVLARAATPAARSMPWRRIAIGSCSGSGSKSPRRRPCASAHARGIDYKLSQRCRKLIEEVFGEGEDWYRVRRFRRRGYRRVQQEALLSGSALNLRWLVKASAMTPQPV